MMRNKILDRRRLGRIQTGGMFSNCKGLTRSTHCGAAMNSDVHRVMWSDDVRRPVTDLPLPADRHAGCGPAIFLGLFEHEPRLDYAPVWSVFACKRNYLMFSCGILKIYKVFIPAPSLRI